MPISLHRLLALPIRFFTFFCSSPNPSSSLWLPCHFANSCCTTKYIPLYTAHLYLPKTRYWHLIWYLLNSNPTKLSALVGRFLIVAITKISSGCTIISWCKTTQLTLCTLVAFFVTYLLFSSLLFYYSLIDLTYFNKETVHSCLVCCCFFLYAMEKPSRLPQTNKHLFYYFIYALQLFFFNKWKLFISMKWKRELFHHWSLSFKMYAVSLWDFFS